jgi:hypothetical protein
MADQVPEDAQLDSIVSTARADVQVVAATDAASAAIELAQRTGGELCSDASSIEAAIAARLVDEAQIEELRRLATELTHAALPEMFDEAAVEAARNRIVAVGTMIACTGVSVMIYALSRAGVAPAGVLGTGIALAVAVVDRYPSESPAPEGESIDAETLHRRAAARWRVAWAVLGVDEPPAPDELDARVQAITQDARSLVLVDPVRWLPAERLRELLQRLPAHAEVYIVKQR